MEGKDMKYEVHTIIQARITVDATDETAAFTAAEERARQWMEDQDTVAGKIIVAAREADEISA